LRPPLVLTDGKGNKTGEVTFEGDPPFHFTANSNAGAARMWTPRKD
jgi:hypothetical protein